jgi:hypothetical protein
MSRQANDAYEFCLTRKMGGGKIEVLLVVVINKKII